MRSRSGSAGPLSGSGGRVGTPRCREPCVLPRGDHDARPRPPRNGRAIPGVCRIGHRRLMKPLAEAQRRGPRGDGAAAGRADPTRRCPRLGARRAHRSPPRRAALCQLGDGRVCGPGVRHQLRHRSSSTSWRMCRPDRCRPVAVGPGQATRIMTGAPLARGGRRRGDGRRHDGSGETGSESSAGSGTGTSVRAAGSDVAAGERCWKPGIRLGSVSSRTAGRPGRCAPGGPEAAQGGHPVHRR